MANKGAVSPYTRLKDDFREFVHNVYERRVVTMFSMSREGIYGKNYNIIDLYERVIAANQLGYDVRLRVDKEGKLVAEYIQKLPTRPWFI